MGGDYAGLRLGEVWLIPSEEQSKMTYGRNHVDCVHTTEIPLLIPPQSMTTPLLRPAFASPKLSLFFLLGICYGYSFEVPQICSGNVCKISVFFFFFFFGFEKKMYKCMELCSPFSIKTGPLRIPLLFSTKCCLNSRILLHLETDNSSQIGITAETP